MADKFVDIVSGVKTLKTPIASTTGASDADKVIKTDSGGKIDVSFMPTGISAETKTVTTSEDLSAGDWVNIYDSSGTATARKADASGGHAKLCNGFVLSSSTSGNNATVYLSGVNNQVSGLTAGTTYFLSGTAGAETATAPSTATHIIQILGQAISATELVFTFAEPFVIA